MRRRTHSRARQGADAESSGFTTEAPAMIGTRPWMSGAAIYSGLTRRARAGHSTPTANDRNASLTICKEAGSIRFRRLIDWSMSPTQQFRPFSPGYRYNFSVRLLNRSLNARILLHRRARAHEVAVAVGVVDTPDGRPELVLAHPLHRERRALARVRPRPLVAQDHLERVRRVLQGVVVLRERAARDLADLAANRHQGRHEPVQLGLRFALGGLDHQRPGHRERDRGRVEAVVHEPLCDVLNLHTRRHD